MMTPIESRSVSQAISTDAVVANLTKFHHSLLSGIDAFNSGSLFREFPLVVATPAYIEQIRTSLPHHRNRILQDAAIEACLGDIPRSLSGGIQQLQELGMELVQETQQFSYVKTRIRNFISGFAGAALFDEAFQKLRGEVYEYDTSVRRAIQISAVIGMLFTAGFLQDTIATDLDAQNFALCMVAIGLKFVLVGVKASMKDSLMTRMGSLVDDLKLGNVFGKLSGGLPRVSSSRSLKLIRRSSSLSRGLPPRCNAGVC